MHHIQMITNSYHPKYIEIISVMGIKTRGNEKCPKLHVFFSEQFMTYTSHVTLHLKYEGIIGISLIDFEVMVLASINLIHI